MSTVPKITQEYLDAAADQMSGYELMLDFVNKVIEIALAEQQESEYITAAQARELGPGAEYFAPDRPNYEWVNCGLLENFPTTFHDGEVIKYRAIKQAQPEPVDKHATLRAEYAKQVAEGTTGFYLWEYKYELQKEFITLDYSRFVGFNIDMHPDHNYHCTDISCYVSKDGEPAIRMLLADAEKLKFDFGNSVDWFITVGSTLNLDIITNHQYELEAGKTYTYKTKATIKLGGNMVTLEQAAAEWEAKREMCDIFYRSANNLSWWNVGRHPAFDTHNSEGSFGEYEIRPKQPTWTGSREDVIALLKEVLNTGAFR